MMAKKKAKKSTHSKAFKSGRFYLGFCAIVADGKYHAAIVAPDMPSLRRAWADITGFNDLDASKVQPVRLSSDDQHDLTVKK